MPSRIADGQPNNMPIIAHICDSVKEYISGGAGLVLKMVAEGLYRCQICFKALHIHSWYTRRAKETGEVIIVAILRCESKCAKGDALLPDFISPRKHYSIREIEKVVSEAQSHRVSEIDTAASESTARRWIAQVGERMEAAASVIKAAFVGMGAAVSELLLDPRGGFAELESLLDRAPRRVRHSGTTLGLANIWLNARPPPAYI